MIAIPDVLVTNEAEEVIHDTTPGWRYLNLSGGHTEILSGCPREVEHVPAKLRLVTLARPTSSLECHADSSDMSLAPEERNLSR